MSSENGDGIKRVVIERVSPAVDCGRFPVKRIVGDTVVVGADVFADGHDILVVNLLCRHLDERVWHSTPMRHLGNDRWEGEFQAESLGSWFFTVEGSLDHFATWRHDLERRQAAGQKLGLELQIGANLVEEASLRAGEDEADLLAGFAAELRKTDDDGGVAIAANPVLQKLLSSCCDRSHFTRFTSELEVLVERETARFSTWYELFPRSCPDAEGDHGSFASCEKLLPAIAAMGFDVVYLPPVHPIGITNRKGKNNNPVAESEDPGSPWAIGSSEGGHTSLHPNLGSFDEFRGFILKARKLGLEVALDIAFQCSPDHPYVSQHPEWFCWRPDGTVQYAENPPKKYQDVIPFDFETTEWQSLWGELLDVFRFWIGHGVTIFRVDNPHTKPFPFWEWVIRQLKREHPGVIFLSEAFTRPKVMYRLAKLGFSQSYTYFSWRNTRREIEEYLTELTQTEVREFFRPNFWPNTPDILPEFLQYGGKPAFAIRYLLAATLSASCGIYGPPFELLVDDALPGTEEYRDSEKYQIRRWQWGAPESLHDFISCINRIRRENIALRDNWNLRFCDSDDDNVIAYLKSDAERTNVLLVVVSLDPFSPRQATVTLPPDLPGVSEGHPFLVDSLISGERQIWHRAENLISFDPKALPGEIFHLRSRLRRENQFDYFL